MKKNLQTILIICLLFWEVVSIYNPCLAQNASFNISYRRLTQEHGLTSKGVNTGLQDSRGFIWLGTRDGLNRYDGNRFQLFTAEKNGLQSNNVVDLCEDAENKLWILYGKPGVNTISLGKMDIMDVGTHVVVSFNAYFPDAPFKQNEIAGMAVNKFHEVFVYLHSGFLYAYLGDKRFKKLNDVPALKSAGDYFVFINHATDSGFWLRYDHYVNKQGKTVKAPRFETGYRAMCFEGEEGMLMMKFTTGEYASYNEVDIVRVSPRGTEQVKSALPKQTARLFYEICRKDFYIVLRDDKTATTLVHSGGQGTYIYKDRQLISILDTTFLRRNPSLGVTDFFTDAEGQYWLCTTNGVVIVSMNANRFTHYLNSAEFKLPDNRKDHQMRGICADTSGNIYVGGSAGVYHIVDRKVDKPSVARINGDAYIGTVVGNNSKYYYGHTCLYEYEAVQKKEHILFNTQPNEVIWTMYPLSEGNWWVSTARDFYLVRGGKFGRIQDGRTGMPVSGAWIHQFYRDRRGSLWAVGSTGLYLMKDDSTVKIHYGTQETDPKLRLPYDDFHCMHEDANGNFWLASDGSGLYKWERGTGLFHHFTIADGLSSNVLYGILEDENHNLWISGDNGLMRFNTKTNAVKTYTVRDGITNNEFNRLSYFKAADGRMFFGGIDGVTAFYPRDFQDDRQRLNAQIQVTAFNRFTETRDRLEDLTVDLYRDNKISLNPGDNFFTLEFALLQYMPGKHRYAYKIDGVDKDWNYQDANVIRVSGLPYGEHMLRIKAQNNEGQWSARELAIPVIVAVPFYMRPAFLGLCIVLGLLAIVLYTRYRVWQYEKRNKVLEDIVHKRTSELQESLEQKDVLLKEIHHRVKNNLQVVSSLLQLQSQSVTDATAKDALMEGHNRVLSMALIHQKLYQNENLDKVAFDVFAEDLFYHLRGVFIPAGRSVAFVNLLPKLYLSIDAAVPLGLILNELMTNAFKYAVPDTRMPEMRLSLVYEGDSAILEFADNGPGFAVPPVFKGATSLGLRLISRLSKQLRGSVDYQTDNGAVFTFTFPLKEFA